MSEQLGKVNLYIQEFDEESGKWYDKWLVECKPCKLEEITTNNYRVQSIFGVLEKGIYLESLLREHEKN